MRAAVACLIWLLPVAAAAQDGATSAEAGQGTGPMTVQRVHNTFVIAPDFKISRVDGHDARIAGVYGGYLFDEQWLVGAGGYWLTNGNTGRRLGYGGALVGWIAGADRPIAFSARTLLGWGEARLLDTVQVIPFDDGFPFNGFNNGPQSLRLPPRPILPQNVQVRFDQQFFVAEPQVDAVFRLASWVKLDAGAGYRAISGANRNESRLRGATASVSLQVGNF